MDKKYSLTQINSENWQEYEGLLKTLCDEAQADKRSTKVNFKWENWQTNPSSLMNTLVVQKRYDPPYGQFSLIHYFDRPIACSGCYRSDWSSRIMVIGVRTWTNPEFRDFWWHGEIFFPNQIKFSQDAGCIAGVMTFNESSAPLKKFLLRIAEKRTVSLGSKNSRFYEDLIFYEEDFLIKDVPQTIGVKLLSCDRHEFEKFHLPPKV